MPPLETERLQIRPFVMADLEAIHQILDIELGDPVRDAAQLAVARSERRQWLEWSVLNYDALARLHQPPYGDRAIVLKESGEVIGACGYAPVMMPLAQIPYFHHDKIHSPFRNVNEMGLYWAVSIRFQRQGFAAEAGQALIDYAFFQLNLMRLVANTDYDNKASIGVMRKLGMTITQNPAADPPWMQILGVLENVAQPPLFNEQGPQSP